MKHILTMKAVKRICFLFFMNKKNVLPILVAAMAVFLTVCNPVSSNAATVTIEDGTESAMMAGDFYVAGADSIPSAPGQVYSVLTLQNNGLETGSNSISMGNLWSELNDAGITSTSSLVFGFGLNETGGTPSVDITALTMTFGSSLGSGSDEIFELGNDNVVVYNFKNGQDDAEALFMVTLANNFMETYDADSTELFTISSTISGTSDGFEIYFLSDLTDITGSPVPIPGSVWLLGSSLIGIIGFRRHRKK